MNLNKGQAEAVAGVLGWLADPEGEPLALLSGEAGTGKTYCLKQICNQFNGRLIFTAPTNKATKVLRSAWQGETAPETKTIYSLLGLRIQPNGELKELVAPEEEVDLSKYVAVFVDEGSMVNGILMVHIRRAQALHPKLKFLFIGDSAQLPPVKESDSPIWGIKKIWTLTEQMRNAGPILQLAKELRRQQTLPAPAFKRASVLTDFGNVHDLQKPEFEDWIRSAARSGMLGTTGEAKIIAWRNDTVDTYNRLVRRELYDTTEKFVVGDRVLLTAPARDFIEGAPLGHTDDEGVVDRCDVVPHPLHTHINVWRLAVTLDNNRKVVFYTLHDLYEAPYAVEAENRAAAARVNGRKWKDFWEFKESFHELRHAYAITAHRSQGSTYEIAFVDWRDILINRDRAEAYKCLYVACTRAKTTLVLG